MAHWHDIGGMLGGITTDIYSEGLQMPIVKIYRAGVVESGHRRHHPHERAHPERAMGDLRAQITAIRTGETRFLELLDRYGREPVLDSHRRDHGPVGASGARAHALPFPMASMRPSPSWTMTASISASAFRSASG